MIERNSQAEEVFSDAWQQVLAGRSIESVVADYPDQAAELEPMLRLTNRVCALSAPSLSPDALSRIQQRTRSALGGRGHDPVAAAPGSPNANELPAHVQAPVRDTRAVARHRPWFAPLFSTVQVSTGALLLLVMVTMVTAMALVFAATNATNATKLGHETETPPAVAAYSGIITRIEGAVWHVVQGDETEVLIDDATEIHGQPMVGATMHCIGEPLGAYKMRAFEVWVGAEPGAPTVTPKGPNGRAPDAPDGDLSLAP